MSSNIPHTGLGAPAELERAIARAALLDYGETLIIPCGTTVQDAERVRQFFFRQRKRAIKEAMRDSEADPSEADPWRGLTTGFYKFEDGRIGLAIYRPPKIETLRIIRADGKVEEEGV